MTPAAYHTVQFSAIGFCLPPVAPWFKITTIIIDIPATLAANTLLVMPIVVCIAILIIADSWQLWLGRFIREFHLSGNWFCPCRAGCVLKPRLSFWVLKVTDTDEGKRDGVGCGSSRAECLYERGYQVAARAPGPHTHMYSIDTLIHIPLKNFILPVAWWPFQW